MEDKINKIIEISTDGTYMVDQEGKTLYLVFKPNFSKSITNSLFVGAEVPSSILKKYAEYGYFEHLYTEPLNKLDEEEIDEFREEAEEFYKNGDYDKSIAVYTDIIIQGTKFYRDYFDRGNANFKKGYYKNAIRDFTFAINLFEKNRSDDEENFQDYYVNRGNAYCMIGKYDLAIQDYNKALDVTREWACPPQETEEYANICHLLGQVMGKVGCYDKPMIDYYCNFVEGDQFDAILERAEAYVKEGNFDKAIEDYKEVIDHGRWCCKVYLLTSQAYFLKGDYKNALDYYKIAIEEYREDAFENIPKEMQVPFFYFTLVSQNIFTLKQVPDNMRILEICHSAVMQNGLDLEFVPDDIKTMKICRAAIEQNGGALEFVPENKKNPDFYLKAIKWNGLALKSVPGNMMTEELCYAATEGNGCALAYVPDNWITEDLCNIAVGNDRRAIIFVPENLWPIIAEEYNIDPSFPDLINSFFDDSDDDNDDSDDDNDNDSDNDSDNDLLDIIFKNVDSDSGINDVFDDEDLFDDDEDLFDDVIDDDEDD